MEHTGTLSLLTVENTEKILQKCKFCQKILLEERSNKF